MIENMADLLFVRGVERGTFAIEDDKGAMTAGELAARAGDAARVFSGAGAGKGDRILFLAENSAALVAAMFGAMRIGAAICPVHPLTGRARLKNILENAKPALVVADGPRVGAYLKAGGAAPVLETATLKAATDKRAAKSDMRAGENVFALIYTSGSEGGPLAVCGGHRQGLFVAGAINEVLEMGPKDVIYSGLPLSFDYGLYQVFLALLSGSRLIMANGFPFPMGIPGTILRRGVTVFPAVPSLLAALLKSRLLERARFETLRLVTSTGDVLPAEHAARLAKILHGAKISKMYGLTECKRVSVMPPGLGAGMEHSVGLPLPGTEAVVKLPGGLTAGPGVVGELVVSGPHVMDGYWNAPAETARRFGTNGHGTPFVRTGDLFRMDERGMLTFVARKSKVIKTGGRMVNPAELENFLSAIPAVSEAAVVGVRDPGRGAAVCAALAVDRSFRLTGGDLKRLCSENLSPEMVPSRIFLTRSQLPKTDNGKIHRKMVRSFFMNGSPGEGVSWREEASLPY